MNDWKNGGTSTVFNWTDGSGTQTRILELAGSIVGAALLHSEAKISYSLRLYVWECEQRYFDFFDNHEYFKVKDLFFNWQYFADVEWYIIINCINYILPGIPTRIVRNITGLNSWATGQHFLNAIKMPQMVTFYIDISVFQHGPVMLCNTLFEHGTSLQICRNKWSCSTCVWYWEFKGREFDWKNDWCETLAERWKTHMDW